MSEILSYQDPQLIPSDVYESDEMTPAECFEACVHRGACKRIFERETGELYDAATELACDLCDEWAEA